ncbi:MAG: hypothetical protein LBP67_00150 [Bacteroidales bacterium]|jgi:hypothetical protein|nr:hypothetical protein [Bacteroidales bacterium]
MKKVKILLVFFTLFMISGMTYGQNYVSTNVKIICPETTIATVTVGYTLDLSVTGKLHLETKEIDVRYGDLNYMAHVGSDFFWVNSNAVRVTITVITDSGRYSQQIFNNAIQNVTFDFR